MTQHHHKDERRISQLKRLMLAEQAMHLVIEGCKSGMTRKDYSKDEISNLTAGVVTLYASPFTENRNLGRLEEKYETFVDEKFKTSHMQMMNFRNWHIAHRDLSSEGLRLHVGETSAHILTPLFTILEDGTSLRNVHFMQFTEEGFKQLKELAEFQFKRIHAKANKLAEQLIKQSKKKLPGTYILGEQYP